VTGYGQPEDRRRALEAGFHWFLVKPIEPDELARVLEQEPGSQAS
jgi:CheY-like chemotaxis protein